MGCLPQASNPHTSSYFWRTAKRFAIRCHDSIASCLNITANDVKMGNRTISNIARTKGLLAMNTLKEEKNRGYVIAGVGGIVAFIAFFLPYVSSATYSNGISWSGSTIGGGLYFEFLASLVAIAIPLVLIYRHNADTLWHLHLDWRGCGRPLGRVDSRAQSHEYQWYRFDGQ